MNGLPGLLWLLVLVTALMGLYGFWRPVAFFNLIYPFSVVAMAVIVMVANAQQLRAPLVIQLILLIAWGLRLGLYVLRRERSRSYAAHRQASGYGEIPVVMRPVIWIVISLLYPAMVSPALFGPSDGRDLGPIGTSDQWVGLLIMLAGLALETWADRQKSDAKKAAPNTVVTTGLYGWVRSPNYLGEVVFWLGNLIAGMPFVTGWLRAIVAIGGFCVLALIMLGATKRLETQQGRRYGNDPTYRAWVRRVPILFPGTPVYSFKGLKIPEV
ncbi:DUF1295 domain-containing protein [Nigerium sp.]|uniref:DUF1295 domain-containing protein n=1 Tax=Nigerium sp. TaxID=2042655 RepID=UPI00322141FB